MPALSVRNLTMTFIERNLFTDVSFDVEERDKVGFIGANGVGKTTLFKILNGEISPVSGTVTFSKNVRPGYMEQHACNNPRADVYHELLSVFDYLSDMETEISTLAHQIDNKSGNLDELVERQTMLIEQFERAGGLTYKSRTRSALLGLGFSENDFTMPVGNLSGGQRSKLCLAKLLLSQSNMLLLDEPTNHLDIDAIAWLEGFLRDFKGAMIIISHDRYFLDAAATGIIDLENHRIHSYRGGYTRYMDTKTRETAAYEKAYEKQQEHIRETEEYIRRYKAGIKSKQARGRQSQLNRLERLEKPNRQATLRFHFTPPDDCADKVLDILHGTAGYNGTPLFKDIEMHIKKGETVGLIGPNGAGKTTLLKMITGELAGEKTLIHMGRHVQVGYYSQEQEWLSPDRTVIDEVRDLFNYGEAEARNVLGMFLFRGEDVFKKISLLSGGEKARLSLLCLFLKRPNFLILDEPTNHLDIPTREIMEEAIQAFGGTCLIVSHDRYFLDRTVSRIFAFEEGGHLQQYEGNYSDYALRKSMETQEFDSITEAGNGGRKETSGERGESARATWKKPARKLKFTYQEQKDYDTIEQEMADLEDLVCRLDEDILKAATDFVRLNELSKQKEEASAKLEEKMERWMYLEDLAARIAEQ